MTFWLNRKNEARPQAIQNMTELLDLQKQKFLLRHRHSFAQKRDVQNRDRSTAGCMRNIWIPDTSNNNFQVWSEPRIFSTISWNQGEVCVLFVLSSFCVSKRQSSNVRGCSWVKVIDQRFSIRQKCTQQNVNSHGQQPQNQSVRIRHSVNHTMKPTDYGSTANAWRNRKRGPH